MLPGTKVKMYNFTAVESSKYDSEIWLLEKRVPPPTTGSLTNTAVTGQYYSR
jgi:hypothetical protein